MPQSSWNSHFPGELFKLFLENVVSVPYSSPIEDTLGWRHFQLNPADIFISFKPGSDMTRTCIWPRNGSTDNFSACSLNIRAFNVHVKWGKDGKRNALGYFKTSFYLNSRSVIYLEGPQSCPLRGFFHLDSLLRGHNSAVRVYIILMQVKEDASTGPPILPCMKAPFTSSWQG